MNIESRLKRLEKLFPHPTIPGTSLTHMLAENEGLQWCLGLGAIHLPKVWFYDRTIEGAIRKAEKELLE